MPPTPGRSGSFGAPMPSGMRDADSKAGRGTRAAVVGAVAGLVPAIALGGLRFFLSEEPERAEQLAGNAVFALVYASPYLLTLMASREKRPAVRGGLLAAIGLLSLVASFSTFSLVSVVLLPATFVIWFAAARSLTASVRPLTATLLAAIAGLAVAATVGLSFFALFGIQDPEARCWVSTRGADGQSVWESRSNVSSSPGGMSAGILTGTERGVCVSDIISNSEAAMSIGILAIAFLGALLVSRREWLLSRRSRE